MRVADNPELAVSLPPRVPSGGARRFLVGALCGGVLLSGSVGAFNVLADPYGYAGSGLFAVAILSDRPIKACLVQRLSYAPSLAILGSSRAEKVEPHYLKARTGLRGFNAAVSSATPDDAWAFANLLHDKASGAPQRVLWFLDIESMRARPVNPGLLSTPSLSRYLARSTVVRGAFQGALSMLSWRTAADSWKTIDATLAGGVGSLSHRSCTIRTNGVTEYAPDGYRRFDFHDVAVRRGTPLVRSIGKTIAEYRAIYAGDTRFARSAERRFEQSVSTLNRWHVRPVIVLTPVHPRFARELGPLGWTRRRVELVAYLRSLRPHLRFDLLDASEIRSFHGRPQDFYDGVHMKVANVRRLLDWVVAKAHRDLTPFG